MAGQDTEDGRWPSRKSRRGRPRAQEADRRSLVIETRFSPSEVKDLRARAGRARLTVSALIRRAALGAKIDPPPPTEAYAYASQLARVGNLVNQAVALAHQGRIVQIQAADLERLRDLLHLTGRLVLGSRGESR